MIKLIDSKTINDQKKYTKKIAIPQYEPKNVKPDISELVDVEKYDKLIQAINKSNINETEKIFLRLAATRHIVFNYGLIADYYAHSDKELQELMEQSALVILDFDDAVANGYVNLSNRLKDLISQTQKYEDIKNDK